MKQSSVRHRVAFKTLPFVALGLLSAAIFLSNVAGLFMPPGLDNPEPIGKFLNGNLPATAPSIASATSWEVEPAFPNLTFNDPTTFVADPNSNMLYVGSRDGKIYRFENNRNTSAKQLVLDISQKVAVVWDGGFLGMAMHPEFGVPNSPNRNYFYVWYCARSAPGVDYINYWVDDPIFYNTYLRLSRFTIPDGQVQADPASEQVMINVRLYGGTHRGGGMSFGKDGLLYVTIGEQWRYITAQNVDTTLEGGIIRLDVDKNPNRSHAPRRAFPLPGGPPEQISGVGYWIPNDNPWQDGGGNIFEEYYSIGHRAPHRLSVDQATGRIWVGEVGSASREEVNVINKAGNYGWPYREGTIGGPYGAPPPLRGTLTEPVIDFTRDETNAIIGGYVYRGSRLPMLNGKYLCGGYAQNRIWALTYNEGTGKATKEYLCQFTPGSLSTFGQDNQGEVYLCGLGNNVKIYQLKANGAALQAPKLLSQTGAFKNLNTLEPADGVIPYTVNQPFWSDHAVKLRFIAVPNDGTHNTAAEKIQFSEDGKWQFPKGTVLIKQLDLPINENNPSQTRRLETRFVVHDDEGNFYALTYKWRDNEAEADLVEAAHDKTFTVQTATGSRQQVWHYPSQSECMVCHNATAGFVLGVNTRQLNGSLTYPKTGRTENQLATLDHLGIFNQDLNDGQIPGFKTIADVNENSRSLEDRARSYIDVNCAYCHQPGSGNRAVFDARYTTPLEDQDLIGGIVSDNLGISGAKVIVPQDLDKSILYKRINAIHNAYAMPPLAKNVIDQQGVELIAEWINSLDPNDTPCTKEKVDRSTWSIIYVDSEETEGENGAAANAIDGDPSTIWHSKWYPTADPLPHEIQIDLGKPYQVSGFEYLPRQVGSTNGTITDYDFYVSSSQNAWGAPVSAGTLEANSQVKNVTFAAKEGRYVRLVAKGEASGKPFTTMAELQVIASECISSAGRLEQSIQFGNIPDQLATQATISLSANASSGLGVSFKVISGPAGVNGNQLVLTGIPGTVTVQAEQTGNGEYQAAAPVQQSFEVRPLPTISVLSIQDGQVFDQGEIQVIFESGGALDLANASYVSLKLDNLPAKTTQRFADTVEFSQIDRGAHTLTVSLMFNDGTPLPYPSSTQTLGFTIALKQQTIVFQEIGDQFVDAAPIELVAQANSGLPISFRVLQGPANLDGQNALKVSGLPGLVKVEASQSGNGEFAPALPVVQTFSISKRPQTISWDPIPDQPFNISPVNLDASSNAGLPISYQVTEGPATVNGNQLTITGKQGKITIKANQGGNNVYLAADEVVRSFQLTKGIQTITFDSIPNKTTTDKSFALNAVSSENLPVNFRLVTGKAAKLSGNQVVLTRVAGKVIIAAEQAGNTEILPAPEVFRTFEVTKAQQTIDFEEIPLKYTNDPPFTVQAEASSGLPVQLEVESGPAIIENGTLIKLVGSPGRVVLILSQPGDETYHEAPKRRTSFDVKNSTPTHIQVFSDEVSSLKIFPNPTAHTLFVSFETTQPQQLTLKVYDLHGRSLVKEIHSQAGLNQASISVNNWPSGMYYLQLSNDKILGNGTFLVH